jgi:hypothetical protein
LLNRVTKTICASIHKVVDAVDVIIVAVDKTSDSVALKEKGELFWRTEQCSFAINDNSHLQKSAFQ